VTPKSELRRAARRALAASYRLIELSTRESPDPALIAEQRGPLVRCAAALDHYVIAATADNEPAQTDPQETLWP
jgi:hypothetical protein